MDKMMALRYAPRVLTLATIVLFLVSAYNITGFFTEMFQQEPDAGLKLTQAPNTGDYNLSLTLRPLNHGFLGVDLSTSLRVLDEEGNVLGQDSAHIYVPPRFRQTSTVSVVIPVSIIPNGGIENMKASVQATIEVRTLWNLVGFKNVLSIGSEQP
jgi:hypothetical protein